MLKRCPFLMGHTCYGEACAMWRVEASGEGFCGVGGPVLAAPVAPAAIPAPAAIVTDKQTRNSDWQQPRRRR